MSLLCHTLSRMGPCCNVGHNVLCRYYFQSTVVDVLTSVNAWIAWVPGPGGGEGGYLQGNTFQNLFKFIFDPDNFCCCRWFLLESPEGSKRETVHCKMLLTCELFQFIGRWDVILI